MNPCQGAEQRQQPCVPRKLPGPRRATRCGREPGTPAPEPFLRAQRLQTRRRPRESPRKGKRGREPAGREQSAATAPAGRPPTCLARGPPTAGNDRNASSAPRGPSRAVPPTFLAALHRHARCVQTPGAPPRSLPPRTRTGSRGGPASVSAVPMATAGRADGKGARRRGGSASSDSSALPCPAGPSSLQRSPQGLLCWRSARAQAGGRPSFEFI